MNKSITLRGWYEQQFVSMFHADASPRTVVEYQATLNLWELLTGDPSLGEITSLTLAQFRASLAKMPGRKSSTASPATVNKHLRQLNHLLAKAGPAGSHNRDAVGILEVSPWVKALKTYQKRPVAASLDAITKFYRACPDDWWRAFVVVAFHSGSRCYAIDNLSESDLDFASRRMLFRADFDKRRIERTKPMSACVVRHLVPLRGCGMLRWPKCNTEFYKAWRDIEQRAGLTDAEQFRPHSLKRACGTQLASAGASTWAVKYMLDHAQTDVTGCSYVDPLDGLESIVNRLPILTGPLPDSVTQKSTPSDACAGH